MTENDMTSLLLQLADRGVTGIRVHYAGGGDSGAVEDINYTTQTLNEDDELAFEYVSQLSTYGTDAASNLNDLDSGIYSDIENFAQEKILNDIEDWWNNDGGYGVLSILVPSGKYKIENVIYITNTEEYYHEGNLINQSLN
tara:strand:- start:224 stop:646 length:423 start_codon:yes stop_codon:yes gene_type:complete